MVVESSKLNEYIECLKSGAIRSVEVNPVLGYNADNIDFLAELADDLEELVLLGSGYDYSVLNKLSRLRLLGFEDNKKQVVDLRSFPELETLATTCSMRLKNMESLVNLKRLTLTHYKSKDKNLVDLPTLPKLEELTLIIANIESLSGVDKQVALRRISVFRAPKLVSIAELVKLNELNEVEIEGSKKIRDFEILAHLKKLKKLIVSESGEFKSLAFLNSMPQLEFFSFWGTNVVDGDLSYLEELPSVGFNDKHHYSLKMSHFTKRNELFRKQK